MWQDMVMIINGLEYAGGITVIVGFLILSKHGA